MSIPETLEAEMEVREYLERIERKVDRLEGHLTGNDDPEKGIIVRLDRLEQRQASQVKAFWAVVSAFTVAVASFVFRILTIAPSQK